MKYIINRISQLARSIALLGGLIIVCVSSVNAQELGEKIKGRVIDQYGNPIENVEISVKGTSYSTKTNVDGSFTFNYNKGLVLMMQHPDYRYEERTVGTIKNKKAPVVFTMDDKFIGMQKVVRRPYDIQPKKSFVGAESTVSGDAISNSLSTNILNGLIGRVNGLNIFQYRGSEIHQSSVNSQSGIIGNIPNFGRGVFSDNTMYSVSSRGLSPVVIVDGVQRELYQIDPEAIESVSLQKDALSSMFLGMQSSRGALVITTKNPSKNGFHVSFTGKMGFQSPVKMPKPLDSYRYAYLLNEALQNDGKEPYYSYNDFVAFRNGTNIYTHPNVNWFDEILRTNSTMQEYNLNVSGGNRFAQYFVSLGYLGEDGMFRNDKDAGHRTNLTTNRYSIQSRVKLNITKYLSADVSLFGRVIEGNQPGGSGNGYSDLLLNVYQTPNGAYPVQNPNGTWGGSVSFTNNLKSQAVNSGYIIDDARDLYGVVNLKYDFSSIVKGLSVRAAGNVTTQNRSMTNRTMRSPVYDYGINESGDYGYSMYGSVSTQTNSFNAVSTYQSLYGQMAIDWERQFGAHKVKFEALGDTRQDLNDFDLPSLPSNVVLSGDYNYGDKYFFQAALSNSYYNRYAPNHRWGTFYALGLGWDMAKERFMKDVEWLDQFKIRGVYGKTGNGISNSGYYNYYQSFSEDGTAWYAMGTSQSGFQSTTERSPLANPNITWEKAHKMNIGVDISMLGNRLNITADYYNDKYYDLLQSRGKSIEIIGQGYPAENIGKMRREGVELSATWQDHISAFNYYVTANWNVTKGKILFIDEQSQPYDYLYQTGKPIGAVFGLVAEGFFTSQEEIENSPVIAGYSNIQPGDIKYRDLNNDGVINEFDRTVIGGDKPLSYFGIDLGCSWKGFEFSMLWQGVYNRDLYVSDWTQLEGFQSYGQDYGQAYEAILGRWTPETASTAVLPRLTAGGNNYNKGNGWNSSFWMKNGNFIRLRNINLSYNLPESLCRRYLGGTRIKLFVTGQNLLTLSAYDLSDPEVTFTSYPLQKCITTGFNVKF